MEGVSPPDVVPPSANMVSQTVQLDSSKQTLSWSLHIHICARGPFQKSATPPSVPATPGMMAMQESNDALLDQLAQRQNMFAQLGNFMQQMQGETGSVEVWRQKLKELEELRKDKSELTAKLKRAEQKHAATKEELDKAQQAQAALQKDVEQLNGAVVAGQGARQDLEAQVEQWRASNSQLQVEVKQFQTEAGAAQMLATTNQELNAELGNLKLTMDAQAQDAR